MNILTRTVEEHLRPIALNAGEEEAVIIGTGAASFTTWVMGTSLDHWYQTSIRTL